MTMTVVIFFLFYGVDSSTFEDQLRIANLPAGRQGYELRMGGIGDCADAYSGIYFFS